MVNFVSINCTYNYLVLLRTNFTTQTYESIRMTEAILVLPSAMEAGKQLLTRPLFLTSRSPVLGRSLLLAAPAHTVVLDGWPCTGFRRAMETSGFSPTPFLSFVGALILVRTSFPPQETISTIYTLSAINRLPHQQIAELSMQLREIKTTINVPVGLPYGSRNP
jgi:hypothetical protein